jgi:hypothetical protein
MPGQYATHAPVWPRPVRSYGRHHGFFGDCVVGRGFVFGGLTGLRGGIFLPLIHQPIRLYESRLLLNGEAIEPDELA